MLTSATMLRCTYKLTHSLTTIAVGFGGTAQHDATLDLVVLMQITNHLRLYITDCLETNFLLNAIQGLKLDGAFDRLCEFVVQVQVPCVLDSYPESLIDFVLIYNYLVFLGTCRLSEYMICDLTKSSGG